MPDFRIVALSGRDGSLKWEQSLENRHDWDAALLIEPLLVDLEGAGRCLITAGASADGGIAAINGADGEMLWLQPLEGGTDVWGELAVAGRVSDGRRRYSRRLLASLTSPARWESALYRAEDGEEIARFPGTTLHAPRDRRPFTQPHRSSPTFRTASPCLCLGNQRTTWAMCPLASRGIPTALLADGFRGDSRCSVTNWPAADGGNGRPKIALRILTETDRGS